MVGYAVWDLGGIFTICKTILLESTWPGEPAVVLILTVDVIALLAKLTLAAYAGDPLDAGSVSNTPTFLDTITDGHNNADPFVASNAL